MIYKTEGILKSWDARGNKVQCEQYRGISVMNVV